MTYPPYMREKARQLRSEKDLTIDEIAERLAIGRTTVFYWVGDMPRPKRCTSRQAPNQRLGNQAMQAKYKRLRAEAYELGYWEFPRLDRQPTFRDFVCVYVCEGYKRDRNSLSVSNSDPTVVLLADYWIRQFARNPVSYAVQFHADQSQLGLQRFWGGLLQMPSDRISLQRKSNSSQLSARTWRSKHGVLTVRAADTQLRARLQGWVDRLKQRWLDSTDRGVAQPGSAHRLGR